jgi:hypothetical protein
MVGFFLQKPATHTGEPVFMNNAISRMLEQTFRIGQPAFSFKIIDADVSP